jgi:hypothetical protein
MQSFRAERRTEEPCHSERSREAARVPSGRTRNRDHTGRGATLPGRARFLDSLPLARNDSPAVLQFIRPIVVPTGPGAMSISGIAGRGCPPSMPRVSSGLP